jgi:hypothetical protein
MRVFTGQGEGSQALRAGEIDPFTGDGIRLYGALARLPEGAFEIPEGVRLAVDSFGTAVRKDDGAFLRVVNAALSDMDRASAVAAAIGPGREPPLRSSLRRRAEPPDSSSSGRARSGSGTFAYGLTTVIYLGI